MYEKIGNLMCPLASFMKYLSKLNPENNAFWQQPSDSYTDTSNLWYIRTLSSMLTKISELSKLSMVYTNHSIRATTITEMDEGGIATTHIMRVSEHKSEESVKHYVRRLSDKKKREISDCLNDTPTNSCGYILQFKIIVKQCL
jgi:hypothetical protein